jgi:two-component system phosphate regulon response regulator PhoB
MWKLLVIDNEKDRTEQIADWFGAIGFAVIRTHSGPEGIRRAEETQPDIILLDYMMPGMDGHEVLLRLKRNPATKSIPVVVCSIKADELDGLKDLMQMELPQGATYIVARKWGLPALEEVVKNTLALSEQQVICVGKDELKLEEGCTEAWVNGEQKELTQLEARVLDYLNGRRGEPCHVNDILDAVWEGVGTPNNVYKVIRALRQKLAPASGQDVFIVNIKNHGYKLVEGD